MSNNFEEKYRLIGVLNILDVKPDFVYPIFEHGGKYYTQRSYDYININEFELLTDYVDYVESMAKYQYVTSNLKPYYTVGDEYLVGFQIDDEKLYIGDTESFIDYINTIPLNDNYANIAIMDFINEVNQTKLLKK